MITVQSISRHLQKQIDPLHLFKSLTDNGNKPHSILFETADSKDGQSAKSILHIQSALRISLKKSQIEIKAVSSNGESSLENIYDFFSSQYDCNYEITSIQINFKQPERHADPIKQLRQKSVLDILRQLLDIFDVKASFKDIFSLNGAFSYDLIDYFEQLQTSEDRFDFPDYVFFLPEHSISYEHQTNKIYVYYHVFDDDQSSPILQDSLLCFEESIGVIESLEFTDSQTSVENYESSHINVSLNDDDFERLIRKLLAHIQQGDIYQVVPSRCFELECQSAVDAYQVLRQSNPSPYMFYIKDDDYTLFAASPESSVKYDSKQREVSLNPIAGTKPRAYKTNRTLDYEQDNRYEIDLLLNEKEKAEHIMLLDLARNDLAKISKAGSRHVSRMMQVEKYSRVMHLVSEVKAELESDLDALHAYQACLNMGTLSGSPKVKASQLLREHEPQLRGPYGGAVGYLNKNGDMDTCIVIRAALVKNSMAYVQAGAGIVYDSDPESEVAETRHKASAVISAIKSCQEKELV